MKGDIIPDGDNIARCCKPTYVDNGEIQATVFMLRAGEESLSVNWLEFLKCSDRASEVRKIQKIYSATFNRVGASARTAILNVGQVRHKVRTESPDRRNLEVLHDPIPHSDQSHSAIYNLKHDDELIAELILEAVHEDYPAREQ